MRFEDNLGDEVGGEEAVSRHTWWSKRRRRRRRAKKSLAEEELKEEEEEERLEKVQCSVLEHRERHTRVDFCPFLSR